VRVRPGRPIRCPNCHSTSTSAYEIWNDYEDVAECWTCKKQFSYHEEIRDLFHQLWGLHTTCGNYEKALWKRLQSLVGW